VLIGKLNRQIPTPWKPKDEATFTHPIDPLSRSLVAEIEDCRAHQADYQELDEQFQHPSPDGLMSGAG
jgi:hypothetical protein